MYDFVYAHVMEKIELISHDDKVYFNDTIKIENKTLLGRILSWMTLCIWTPNRIN